MALCRCSGECGARHHGSALGAIVAPGAYTFMATSAVPDVTGSYTTRYTKPTSSRPSCGDVLITHGVEFFGTISQLDCVVGGSVPNHTYRIFLRVSSSIAVTLTDESYSAPHVALYSGAGALLANGASTAYYVEKLDFTAPSDGYYLLRVSAPYDDGTQYKLSVK